MDFIDNINGTKAKKDPLSPGRWVSTTSGEAGSQTVSLGDSFWSERERFKTETASNPTWKISTLELQILISQLEQKL